MRNANWDTVARFHGFLSLKHLLEELYTKKGMSARQIGEKLGVTVSSITYWLRQHGIEVRKRGGANRLWKNQKQGQ